MRRGALLFAVMLLGVAVPARAFMPPKLAQFGFAPPGVWVAPPCRLNYHRLTACDAKRASDRLLAYDAGVVIQATYDVGWCWGGHHAGCHSWEIDLATTRLDGRTYYLPLELDGPTQVSLQFPDMICARWPNQTLWLACLSRY